MISVVICSRTNFISESLQNNIQETIGEEHELIIIDNSLNNYSIFEAYNLGIRKSKGQYICFMHDDIGLKTSNWGAIINRIFQENSKIGLIGIAGSKIKTKMPSAWWDCADENLCMNIIQHFSTGKKEHWVKGFKEKRLEKVAAIDGVFMVARKVNTICFNENLKGFHNYDLNFSFEYLKSGYNVVVTKDILLEHFSIGVLNKSWYESTLELHKVYKNLLPLNFSNNLTLKDQEFKNGEKFLINAFKHNIKRPLFMIWFKLILIKPLTKFHLRFLKTIIQ
ncbi:glycosyltransferase [Flavobacterium sp. MC2016-06]|jgi:glycosyltransferase involved in cell wall biosynthesis|uniref:glycosyltransferase n=1 Tax=Flavobacterium sp. MC2016-06 TaxID=2676308 RepID=UPI0012BAE304|nr:glycosyltransferase [Flavobacterium sp. MC2016-06]MBU3858662.1 glycosyltransferase family protein [Flavobacterium sp. MC2016-06]